ncbi:MAG: non-ribosomal peptide synthetase, partial [Silvibacterium sp.]|nr:non-ribosomal peptide synthetase [Silvibacterium sp.]
PLDRCLNVMPLFHIHGLIGALLSSVVARSTFITSPELDPAEFRRWLTDAEATWFTAVPTILQAIAQAMRKDKGRAPASLRFVRSCSAPLPPQLATELETLLGIPVLQAYGMTEASHQISSNPLPPLCRKSSSVGLPTGFEIRILDDTHRILASGRRGEVCIAGPSLFGGYVDNPEANRASFVDGFFRTGDEGYLDDDGYLFLTGRLKEMINRGGEKIAPAEIDMVLLEHPSIAEAICFAISHPSLGEDIAAAVVVQTGTTVNLPSLQEFVSERLASHKIPQKLFILGALPKSPSGKVLRRELTARFREDVPLPSDAPAPHAEADREALMRRVWREVLDLDAVGLDDDYFMLGGDSLQAVTIIGKMKALGIELSMVDFVRRRSIRRMCAAMAIAA